MARCHVRRWQSGCFPPRLPRWVDGFVSALVSDSEDLVGAREILAQEDRNRDLATSLFVLFQRRYARPGSEFELRLLQVGA